MQLSSALRILVAAITLGSSASLPAGDQNVAIAAVTEARDELKSVVQQLGEQQEQITALTKEVAELRAAKKLAPATSATASAPSTTVGKNSSDVGAPSEPQIAEAKASSEDDTQDAQAVQQADQQAAQQIAQATQDDQATLDAQLPEAQLRNDAARAASPNQTSAPRKVLTSLRAIADRAEHVLVGERPRTPWWAEKQHTRGPAELPGGGGYFGESNTDPTFGRHRYYPAGWSVDPRHKPYHPSTTGSFDVYASSDSVLAASPPAPAPSPVPILQPLTNDSPPPVDIAPEQSAQTSRAPHPPHAEPHAPPPPPSNAPPLSNAPPPSASVGAPPPPSASALRPKNRDFQRDLAHLDSAQAAPLKTTMGFFGPPPSGTLPNAPASA